MTAAALRDEDLTGRLLGGRFRVRSALGMGGMGVVYEAEDIVLGREVALKLLHSDGDDETARLEREARAASRISARHVAAVYDVGQDPEFGLYMVMERLRGLTLEDRIAVGKDMPVSEVAAIGTHIAMALEAAHAAGVVHRDLKPGNVFLLEDGGLKVMDFGIAKIVEGSPSDTETLTDVESIVGTPAYIAPEAVRKGEVGAPADVYALGIMLFEMLSGERPFSDESHVVVCAAHLKEPPPLLKNVAPGLPSSLSPLVDAMLRKKPNRRPSLGEVRAALLPLTPAPGTTGAHQTASPFTAQRRNMVLVAAGLLAVGVLGIALMSNTADGEEYQSTPLPSIENALPPSVEGNPESAVMEGSPTMMPVGVEPPAPVRVRVQVMPPRAARIARLTWDGQVITANPFLVTPDDVQHELSVTARGYAAGSKIVRLDADDETEITIRLRAARRPPGKMLPDIQRMW